MSIHCIDSKGSSLISDRCRPVCVRMYHTDESQAALVLWSHSHVFRAALADWTPASHPSRFCSVSTVTCEISQGQRSGVNSLGYLAALKKICEKRNTRASFTL